MYATRRIFYIQNLKPSYLDARAELEPLIEASAIDATRRSFCRLQKKKVPAALGQAKKNAVLMCIGMTAAENDERSDKGLARTDGRHS